MNCFSLIWKSHLVQFLTVIVALRFSDAPLM